MGQGRNGQAQSSKNTQQLLWGKRTHKLPFLLSHYTVTICVCVCVCVLITQSCPTLHDPMDCSPPGSSVHGILQARTLEWVVISFSNANFSSSS